MSGMLGSRAPRVFDTQLPDEREMAFQRWRSTLPPDLQNDEDYDLRGAWVGQAQQNGNAHLPDTWKKPNHMTFSTGSQYSTPQQQGGDWQPNGQFDGEGYTFWASPENTRQHDGATMADYFKRYEPKSTLVLPYDFRLKAGR